MRVLIIEDEQAAGEHLKNLLREVEPGVAILSQLPSSSHAVTWLNENETPDLIFLDIHLSGDSGFDLFKSIEVKAPVIFTTGDDQRAIEAFKVNSIDYLLKPIQKEELIGSLSKFKKMGFMKPDLESLISSLKQKQEFQTRFLVTSGELIKSVDVSEVAYFLGQDKYAYLITGAGQKFLIDHNLSYLEEHLNPDTFFRINRQFIIGIHAIDEMFSYSRSRIRVILNPPVKEPVIVSVERSPAFKKWLGK